MIEACILAQSELLKYLWADPNHVFNSKEYCDKMIEVSKEYWSDCEAKGEAIPFNPKAKTHTQNQWRKSRLLRQPYQCAKWEDCNHNPVLFTSPQHNCNYKNFPATPPKLSKRIVNPRRSWSNKHTNDGCDSAMTAKNITVY